MSKQLTAIEYAAKKIKADIHIYGGEGWDVMEEVLTILHDALEMEYAQMKECIVNNVTTNEAFRKVFEKQFEEYYKKTYGQPIITITTKPDNHD